MRTIHLYFFVFFTSRETTLVVRFFLSFFRIFVQYKVRIDRVNWNYRRILKNVILELSEAVKHLRS